MRRSILLLLAALLLFPVTSCARQEQKPDSGELSETFVQVDYYCSAGDYMDLLREEIGRWNETEGAAKGVMINLIPNLNAYNGDLELLMESGTHYDLADFGGSRGWYEKGWVVDLSELPNEEIRALIQSYASCFVPGEGIYEEAVTAVPLSAAPVKMAVNLDLFEKNGLDLPATWDEVVCCAEVITENGGEWEFGFGWSNWTEGWQQYCFALCAGSAGSAWWNPKKAAYDFSLFKEPAEQILRMQRNFWTYGADCQPHDTVCALFSEGRIGMLPYASYRLFAERYPAKCSWTVIDPPRYGEGDASFKGVYQIRQGCGLDRISYEEADERKKQAMEEAWLFLNGDELVGRLYAEGALIPVKEAIRETVEKSADLGPQWEAYADLEGYRRMGPQPTSVLPLEGEPMHLVLEDYQHGTVTFDEAAEDLNTRYNRAYQELKAGGDVDTSVYEKP